MGGSFHPPTRAHVDFLLDAMWQMEAKEGGSLSRLPTGTVPGRWRSIRNGEYGDDGRGHTYETLETIQADRPGYRVLFLIGADKLDIIPRWKDIEHLLHRFELVVSARDENSTDVIRQYIKHHPMLAAYQERFHILSRKRRYPDGEKMKQSR